MVAKQKITSSTKTRQRSRFFSSFPTVSFVRITLALIGYYVSSGYPLVALSLWIMAAFLDDCEHDGDNGGTNKRSHGNGRQQFKSVIALDLFADILLRTVGWMAVATTDHHSSKYLTVAISCIMLEWTTLLTSHLHATLDYDHWKQSRARDPMFVRAFFRNRFQNVLGQLGTFGLFASDLVCFAASHNISRVIPFFGIVATIAMIGRLLVACIEMWLCSGFAVFLIQNLRAKKDLFVQTLTDSVMNSVAWHTVKLL